MPAGAAAEDSGAASAQDAGEGLSRLHPDAVSESLGGDEEEMVSEEGSGAAQARSPYISEFFLL